MSRIHFAIAAIVLTSCATVPSSRPEPDLPAAYTAEEVARRCRAGLAEAEGHLKRLLNGADPMEAYNDLSVAVDRAWSLAGVMARLHPDKPVRDLAEGIEQELSRFFTGVQLNRDVFEGFRAVDVSRLDADGRRLVERVLRDFRRAGVDKDEPTRERIRALQDEITRIGQDFERHIADDVRTVEVDSLAGLPEDYVASHKPNASGKFVVSTRYPDVFPFLGYAEDVDGRRRLHLEFNNRGNPANVEVLDRLLARRHELAGLLGYPHWAAYVAEDKMIKDHRRIESFVREIAAGCLERSERDKAVLLEARGQDRIDAWDVGYYSNRVKKERYDFDPQSVREYFEYDTVKAGLLALMADLFELRFEPMADAPVWHPSVDVYRVRSRDDGALLGRIYLDMHPRDGKFSHAAQSTLQRGVRGRQVPVGVLMCNFPDPAAGPALMEHGQVRTFFHEFGHLVHALLGGDQRWLEFSGVATEHDFVEAPSQLLEEWIWDAAVLRRFARHHRTAEPIPVELVEKMRAADAFGRGLAIRRQMSLAMISYRLYDRDPSTFDTAAECARIEADLAPFGHTEGTNHHLSFGHLEGYSAAYYTYAWSQVIAKDLFTRFEAEGLLDPGVAQEYRRTVLAPGGTGDAADLVKEFLGRPYSFDAYNRWASGDR